MSEQVTQEKYAGADLRTRDFSGQHLDGVDFHDADLYQANFKGAYLNEANFEGANLTGATFEGAAARRANFTRANLLRANLSHIQAPEADFTAADLSHANLEEARIYNGILVRTYLAKANLEGANLSGRLTNLEGAYLDHAIANDACFTLSSMKFVHADHLQAVGANFRQVILDSAQMHEAILTRADFELAELDGVILVGANLVRARFKDTTLIDCRLTDADLTNALMQHARVQGGEWNRANLTGAKLEGLSFSGGVDLSQVQGIPTQAEWLELHLEKSTAGYLAYKTFNSNYPPPPSWEIEVDSVLTEQLNRDRGVECGCGINVATREWVVAQDHAADVFKVLIRWEWLTDVCVPYGTQGKFRIAKGELVERTSYSTFYRQTRGAEEDTEA